MGVRTRGRKVSGAVSGLVAAALVFALVPTVLVVLAGVPIPHPLDKPHVLSARGLYDLLALCAWIAWARCCWPLLLATLRRVRLRDTMITSGARFGERLAARIAATVLTLAPLFALASNASALGRVTPVSRASVVAMAPSPTHPSVQIPAENIDSLSPVATAPISLEHYSVEPGDTLWSIAERFYGDGDDWESIARLNLGRVMVDGRRFMDPSLLYPGWSLVVQAPVTADPAPVSPTATRAAPTISGSTVQLPPVHRTVDRLRARPAGSRVQRSANTPSSVPLPELVLLGLGVLGAAAVSRRVRRLRRGTEDARLNGASPYPTSEEAVDAESLLRRFDGAPVLEWFEFANRHLAWALTQFSGPVPRVRLWRVGPDGVDAWLDEPVSHAPREWVRSAKGWVWHLPAKTDPCAPGRLLVEPASPIALHVGDDSSGSWLIALERGSCLPVIGARADQLVTSMRVTQESWSWAEGVLVTDDPDRACRTSGDRVLFIGDPRSLDDATRRRCGLLTTLPLPASDVTVTVDDQGVSLHPLGITLRAHLQDADQSGAIADLLLGAAAPPEVFPREQRETHGASLPMSALEEALVPGCLEVRLLTPVPRLEGLREELEVKRARRATELVAYLALHHPDPVTGDRLRTRVLGSADADAAAKTLFNTAGAARRAMGMDQDGGALFPSATKSGHYRLSTQVSVDVVRAARLVEAARDAPESDTAIALYRAALDLVEGEPLGGVLAGYGWWQAEGHAGRITALLVDAACDLSRLATEAGLGELSAWALRQARYVDPYSEAITRASMRAAAAQGDGDRLRREWVECQQRADELDPGTTPSERTEQLYAALSKKVLVAAS